MEETGLEQVTETEMLEWLDEFLSKYHPYLRRKGQEKNFKILIIGHVSDLERKLSSKSVIISITYRT
jgi:hypothetical protein